jgi:hypothetical protein
MIRKTGHRFSEKIMLKQKDRAGLRLEENLSRSDGGLSHRKMQAAQEAIGRPA